MSVTKLSTSPVEASAGCPFGTELARQALASSCGAGGIAVSARSRQRLVRFLLLEARTNGRRVEGGWDVDLRLSERQIAGRQEVISRKLKRLQTAKAGRDRRQAADYPGQVFARSC